MKPGAHSEVLNQATADRSSKGTDKDRLGHPPLDQRRVFMDPILAYFSSEKLMPLPCCASSRSES